MTPTNRTDEVRKIAERFVGFPDNIDDLERAIASAITSAVEAENENLKVGIASGAEWNQELLRSNSKLKAENSRLREALEKIAEYENGYVQPLQPSTEAMIAKAALEGTK